MAWNREIRLDRRDLIAGGLAASAAALATAAAPAARAAEPAPTTVVPPDIMKGVEAWSGSLAVQAATYAAPMVAMYLLRDATCFKPGAKAKPNAIWRIENIATPEIAAQSGYVTPNVNVVYGFGFMDLAAEPIILSAPDSRGRYYMIEVCDMWTNAFAYPAGGPSGYAGGTFALVGPGWKGQLPPDVTRIDCPTRWIELQPRVFVKDQADLAGAEAVLSAITVKGLAERRGGPAPAPADYRYEAPKIAPNVASSQLLFDDPLQFWSIFTATMNENPPPAAEVEAVLPMFKYLGIELGKPWKPEAVNPAVLAEMKQAAAGVGKLMAANVAIRDSLQGGWAIPPGNVGMPGADYLTRAIIAVVGLTANTVEQAIYYNGLLDSEGAPLTGAKRYTATFSQPMTYIEPVPPGFWSLTMYDNVTKLTVTNPIDRYSLGASDPIKRDADGSFTLYIQRESPGADKESNWLPAPAGPFYLILRNYAPAPAAVKAIASGVAFKGPPSLVPVG
ncbi:DUF1254 domain-containing protein [Roseiarcus fermentans]|nr:DUF1254 domain-containing protein [Roseiarcus fermentans]